MTKRDEAAELASEDTPIKRAHRRVCGGVASVYVRGQNTSSQGTAFAIDKRGYFMTNAHVIEGADTVDLVLDHSCTEGDGQMSATIVAKSLASDVALLKVDAKAPRFTVLQMGDQKDVDTLDRILVIGNPFGYGDSAIEGSISRKLEELSVGGAKLGPIFQLGASINPGNSGGPLVTLDGNVVGLVTAKHAKAEGMGFALYIGKARSALASRLRYQRLQGKPHAYEGVAFDEVNLYSRPQLTVQAVEAKSAAAAGRFEVGDIVMGLVGDDAPINDLLDYEIMMLETEPGQGLALQIKRNGRVMVLYLKRPTLPSPRARPRY